jgi:hypothetical protein
VIERTRLFEIRSMSTQGYRLARTGLYPSWQAGARPREDHELRTHVLAGFALMTVLCGCATVTRGTSEKVEVKSDPAGAAVTTSIDKACKPTPCSIDAPRKTEFTVTVSKPGYLSQTVEVKSKLSAKGGVGMAANMALPGGTIGLVTDVVTGAGLDHDPNPVSVKLQPTGQRKARNRARRRAGT